MPSQFGTAEILIIAALIIVFFGGKKVPEFIRGLGDAVKEFKAGVNDEPKTKKSTKKEADKD